MNVDTNMSRRYRILCRDILDTEMGIAPAYQTRTRDNIHISPMLQVFHNAYQALWLPSLTSKTRESAFQVLNRTVWTKTRTFKSRMRPDPDFTRCGEVEPMEHLLCKYMPYSQLVWICLGEIITQYLNSFSQDLIPRVQTTQLNVIYNVPHL
jgi:hypothetical protein